MGTHLKILHCVQEYYPAVGGMPEVARQISERLVAMGHHVTVACSFHKDRSIDHLNGVNIKSFSITGNLVEGIQGEKDEYRNFLLQSGFDVVTLFAAQQWATDLALDLLPDIKGKKVFVPTGFSYLHKAEYSSYYESMKSWMKEFNANVFLSDDYQDINFARKAQIDKLYLIPNGAAEEEFSGPPVSDIRKRFDIDPGQFLLLHVGGFTGAKGQKEAIQIFLKSRLKNAVLLLAGNNNKRLKKLLATHHRYVHLNLLSVLKRKRIIVVELDRQQTVDAFKSADLFLFPSNIECSPIVLFEAMAAGVPFLSSDVGNAAEIAEWSGTGKILPTTRSEIGWGVVDIDGSARMLDEFASDRQKLKETGRKGRDVWKSRFTWQKITEQYAKLYNELAGR